MEESAAAELSVGRHTRMKRFAKDSVIGILMWGVLGYVVGMAVALALHVRELGHFALTLGFIVAAVMTLNLVRHFRRAKAQKGHNDNAA